MPNTLLVENQKVVPIAAPKSYSSIAAASVWLSLKNYEHVAWIINTGAWAGGTAAVTLSQATAVAGTGSKAIAFSSMWVNTVALADTFTKTAVVSNTFNLDTAGLCYIVELESDTLDVSGGFDCAQIAVASPGANADFYNIVAVLGALHMSRYPGAKPPTALLD